MIKKVIFKKGENFQITTVIKAWLDEYYCVDIFGSKHQKHLSKLVTGLKGQSGEGYKLIVKVNEENNLLFISLHSNYEIRTECFDAAKNLANDINMQLDMGGIFVQATYPFEFKQSVIIVGGNINALTVSNIVNYGIQVFESYVQEIKNVVDWHDPLKLQDLKDAYQWEEIEGHKKLKKWSQELEKACKNKTTLDQWQLIGKAAIIVNKNSNYCSQVLMTVAREAKLNYVKVAKDDVLNTFQSHDFIKLSPVIVYLEPGRWNREKQDSEHETKDESKNYNMFVNKMYKIFENFSTQNPVIYVTSTSNLKDSVKDILKCKGAFDLFMAIPPKSIELVGGEFIKKLGKKICGLTLINAQKKIGYLISDYSERQRELAVLALKRVHRDLKRDIEYIDLVDINLHNLVNEDSSQEKNNQILLQTAYHEAGHALATILEYDGLNIPDYTSILPSASGFSGVTLESIDYHLKGYDDSTYLNMKRSIRVALGGRIGEEILVGPENVSDGASNDLEGATKKASNAFKFNGFSPEMDLPGKSESNLAIISGSDPTASESFHIEKLTREFLAQEYRIVKDKLLVNKLVLDEIANNLITDRIVSSEGLIKICKKYKIVPFKK